MSESDSSSSDSGDIAPHCAVAPYLYQPLAPAAVPQEQEPDLAHFFNNLARVQDNSWWVMVIKNNKLSQMSFIYSYLQ